MGGGTMGMMGTTHPRDLLINDREYGGNQWHQWQHHHRPANKIPSMIQHRGVLCYTGLMSAACSSRSAISRNISPELIFPDMSIKAKQVFQPTLTNKKHTLFDCLRRTLWQFQLKRKIAVLTCLKIDQESLSKFGPCPHYITVHSWVIDVMSSSSLQKPTVVGAGSYAIDTSSR